MTAQDPDTEVEFRQRVVDTMTRVLGQLLERSDPVTQDMSLMEELDFSSTLGLELLLQVEDELEILIDVERMDQDKMRTVGDLATFVVSHSRPG